MWPAGYPGTQHPFKIHGVEKSKKFAGHITVKIISIKIAYFRTLLPMEIK